MATLDLYDSEQSSKLSNMIKKVNPQGDIVLHKSLAGYVFDIQEQSDGSLRLIFAGRHRGKKLLPKPAEFALPRQLAAQASRQTLE